MSQLAVLTCHAYIEFQKDLFIGKMKYQQLFNSFAQIGHPANKFPVDHLINLRNNIDYDKLYDVLDKYKYRHYSANRMKLAIRVTLLKLRRENYLLLIEFMILLFIK